MYDWKDGELMDVEFEEGLSCPFWREALMHQCECEDVPPDKREPGVLVLELVGILAPGQRVGVRIESIKCFNCGEVLAEHLD